MSVVVVLVVLAGVEDVLPVLGALVGRAVVGVVAIQLVVYPHAAFPLTRACAAAGAAVGKKKKRIIILLMYTA